MYHIMHLSRRGADLYLHIEQLITGFDGCDNRPNRQTLSDYYRTNVLVDDFEF